MDNHRSGFLSNGSSEGCLEATSHLKQAIAQGKGWATAILEAMSLWTAPEEVHQGRHYRYLIGGEAFDWLLLAERLCKEVGDLIPPAEKRALLRYGKLPCHVTEDDFRRLLGIAKYQGYLNYYYGVVVEKALTKAVEEEMRKERLSKGYRDVNGVTERAFQKVYYAGRSELLAAFRQEKGYPLSRAIASSESKEFAYWLFKRRLRICDGARIASDTKKSLEWLHKTGYVPFSERASRQGNLAPTS